jgi:hypothetical protein
MLRKTFFLFVFSLIVLLGHAQTKTNIGVSVGTAFSTFKSSNLSSTYNYKLGYRINVPVVFSYSRSLSFSTGLSYLNVGAIQNVTWGEKYSMDSNDPIYQGFFENENTFKDQLNYLSIPLALTFNQRIQSVFMYEKIGAYVSYLVSAKEKMTDDAQSYEINFNFSDGMMNRFDAGVLLGVGFFKYVSRGRVFAEAEYMIGGSNIYKSNSFMFPTSSEVFNRSVFLNIGYVVRLGKSTCY